MPLTTEEIKANAKTVGDICHYFNTLYPGGDVMTQFGPALGAGVGNALTNDLDHFSSGTPFELRDGLTIDDLWETPAKAWMEPTTTLDVLAQEMFEEPSFYTLHPYMQKVILDAHPEIVVDGMGLVVISRA